MTSSTEHEGPDRAFGGSSASAMRRSSTRPSRPLRQRLRLPLMLAGPIVVLLAAALVVPDQRPLRLDRRRLCPGGAHDGQRRHFRPGGRGRGARQPAGDAQGQMLFRIDDRPYRIAVEEAKAAARRGEAAGQGDEGDLHQKLAEMKGGGGHARLPAARIRPAAPAAGHRQRAAFDLRPGAERDAGGAPEGRLDAERRSPTCWPSSAATPTCRSTSTRSVQQRAGGARQGRARPVLHGGPGAGERHRHQGRAAAGRLLCQRVDAGLPDDLEPRLDRGQLQGNRADPYAAGPDRDGRDRHLSRASCSTPGSRA